jgi:hypothetical protein
MSLASWIQVLKYSSSLYTIVFIRTGQESSYYPTPSQSWSLIPRPDAELHHPPLLAMPFSSLHV